MSSSFEEASADLGADTWQTFRYVTLPNMRSALGAGGLLAFGLSFDEIIVTDVHDRGGRRNPPDLDIHATSSAPSERPIVNAVAVIVVLISIIPVYLAHRLTREEGGATAGRGGGGRSDRRQGRDRGDRGALSPSRRAAYSGMLPCLRFGWSTRLVCSMRRARISFGRVWRGSITSSM